MATSEAMEIKKQETLVRFIIISYTTRLRVDLLPYPYQKGFKNFLILSMIVIFPLSIPSRIILVVLG